MNRDRRTPVTVIHVLGSLDRGGVEVRTLELLRHLRGSDVNFVMVTLSGREGQLADEFRAAGARIVPMDIRSALFVPKFMAYIRSNRLAVVHSHVHHTSGFILALARLVGVRTRIAHYRSTGASVSRRAIHRRAKYAVLRTLVSLNATAVLGVSPGAISAWRSDWQKDSRAEVIANGFDMERFATAEVGAFRRELGVGEETPLVVHLGRADIATKNREGALKVFSAYCATGARGVLVFVGRDGSNPLQAGQQLSAWSEMADELCISDRVRFCGERADVPNVFASADLLLFTSRLEGLPGVLVEARLAGVPVVSSRLPGTEYIADRVPGVQVLDLEAPAQTWADAMREALTPRPSADSRAGARVQLRGGAFDLDVVAKAYLRIWRGEPREG